MAVVGKTTWVQPDQVYDQLHHVTIDVSDGPEVANVCHSLFGTPPSK